MSEAMPIVTSLGRVPDPSDLTLCESRLAHAALGAATRRATAGEQR